MREALYRKYRPKQLSDVIGQSHITETLEHALKKKAIRHAYLFTGPKGVGKTSVARIMAHEINGIPYTDDSVHLDIIEIDAASNRRIDEIRDLRDKVNIAPSIAKYKVYIIDEVHMLTKEAFNALLKTLEEPPEHVVFILATTETHKVPATIVSRTQRFPFRQVSIPDISSHLQVVAKKEKITIDRSAIEKISNFSDGSLRDALSLLDQISSYGDNITSESAESLLGIPSSEHIDALLSAVVSSNAAKILDETQRLRVNGLSANQISIQLSERLRSSLVDNKPLLTEANTLKLLKELLLISTYNDPMSALEVALLSILTSESVKTDKASNKVSEDNLVAAVPSEVSATVKSVPDKLPAAPVETLKKPAIKKTPEQAKDELTATENPSISQSQFNWGHILNESKTKYSTLYGLLRMAEVNLTGDILLLTFKFPFHAKQLNQQRNLQKFTEILNSSGQSELTVKTEVNQDALPVELENTEPAPKTDNRMPDNDIESISNIFGGAELLD
ncbi:MAG: DNA polymerase III subunit gamma/tau [bacterium]|nr:DNA polymerase III subunit gamma/tau [bacterium]